jgi:transcriptional regulator with XRE-family HTH domain
MGKGLLVKMLDDKMRQRNLSLRQAGKEIGVSHTTISRILQGQTADIDTLIAMCKWLGISPSDVLDSNVEGPSGLGARIATVLETNPKLAVVFEEAIGRLEEGEITPQTIEDLIAYMSYRLGLDKKE